MPTIQDANTKITNFPNKFVSPWGNEAITPFYSSVPLKSPVEGCLECIVCGNSNTRNQIISSEDPLFSKETILTLSVQPPEIISSGSVNASEGCSFSYLIQAVNYPTSYSATGLPSGFSVNVTTGLITGSATPSGNFNFIAKASNERGTAEMPVSVYVYNPRFAFRAWNGGGQPFLIGSGSGYTWQYADHQVGASACQLTPANSIKNTVPVPVTLLITGVVNDDVLFNGVIYQAGQFPFNWTGGANPCGSTNADNGVHNFSYTKVLALDEILTLQCLDRGFAGGLTCKIEIVC